MQEIWLNIAIIREEPIGVTFESKMEVKNLITLSIGVLAMKWRVVGRPVIFLQRIIPRKHWKLVCIVFVRPEFVESDEDLEYIFTQRGQALYTSDELSKNLVKHNEYNPTGYLS